MIDVADLQLILIDLVPILPYHIDLAGYASKPGFAVDNCYWLNLR